ncbi:hypothetical protein ABPG75_010570 [Micractinium tetrahymenae]
MEACHGHKQSNGHNARHIPPGRTQLIAPGHTVESRAEGYVLGLFVLPMDGIELSRLPGQVDKVVNLVASGEYLNSILPFALEGHLGPPRCYYSGGGTRGRVMAVRRAQEWQLAGPGFGFCGRKGQCAAAVCCVVAPVVCRIAVRCCRAAPRSSAAMPRGPGLQLPC